MSIDDELQRCERLDPEDPMARMRLLAQRRRVEELRGVPPCPWCQTRESMEEPEKLGDPGTLISVLTGNNGTPIQRYSGVAYNVIPYRCKLCGCVAFGSKPHADVEQRLRDAVGRAVNVGGNPVGTITDMRMEGDQLIADIGIQSPPPAEFVELNLSVPAGTVDRSVDCDNCHGTGIEVVAADSVNEDDVRFWNPDGSVQVDCPVCDGFMEREAEPNANGRRSRSETQGRVSTRDRRAHRQGHQRP